jgi:ABC-type sugar transport system substrate-binding protein
MIHRKTLRNVSAALAAALLLAGASTADAARVNRSPTAGVSTTQQGHPSPNWGSYGRGWCYWHPYSCHYR